MGDLIEKGECVLAYDIQPCRGTAGPDGEPGIGAGIVRVRVRRHYSDDPGRPRSRVIAAEDEHRERERLHSQLRRLNPRALEEHADLLRIPIDNADDDTLIADIIRRQVWSENLWASLYDFEGSRLLELLPRYGHIQPQKEVAFGTTRGICSARQTHEERGDSKKQSRGKSDETATTLHISRLRTSSSSRGSRARATVH